MEPSDACTISQISHYDSLLDNHSFFQCNGDIAGIFYFNVYLPKAIITDNDDHNESQKNSSKAGEAYGNGPPQITS